MHVVSQLSLFSAGARPSRITDLSGLLCGPGQIVRFGSSDTARLSIVLADPSRVPAVAAACAEVGVTVEAATTEDGATVVRTAFRRDLAGLAAAWTRGAVKAVPPGMQLDGAMLRLWALASGQPDGRGGYLLGLDPHAPQTHEPLTAALSTLGLQPERVWRIPALRVSGVRRIRRLAELVGPPPRGISAADWPQYRSGKAPNHSGHG